jgi:hypothetical protein
MLWVFQVSSAALLICTDFGNVKVRSYDGRNIVVEGTLKRQIAHAGSSHKLLFIGTLSYGQFK